MQLKYIATEIAIVNAQHLLLRLVSADATRLLKYRNNSHLASIKARHIPRRILRPEHQRATDAACTNDAGAAKRLLPVSSDIVGLPGYDGGQVRVRSSSQQKDAEILHARNLHPRQESDADSHRSLQGIVDNGETSRLDLTAQPSFDAHLKSREQVESRPGNARTERTGVIAYPAIAAFPVLALSKKLAAIIRLRGKTIRNSTLRAVFCRSARE